MLQALRGFETFVWDKRPHQNSSGPMLTSCAEFAVVGMFTIGKETRRDILIHFERGENHDNIQTFPAVRKFFQNVENEPVNKYQKPAQLCQWFIRHYSTPGSLCLDLMAGSGSFSVACAYNGRHSIAFEMDREQEKLLVERMHRAVEQPGEHHPDIGVKRAVDYKPVLSSFGKNIRGEFCVSCEK